MSDYENDYEDVDVCDPRSVMVAVEGPFKIVTMEDVAREYFKKYQIKSASFRDLVPEEDLGSKIIVERIESQVKELAVEYEEKDNCEDLQKEIYKVDIQAVSIDKKVFDEADDSGEIVNYNYDSVAYGLYYFTRRYEDLIGNNALWHKAVSSVIVYLYYRGFNYRKRWKCLLARCVDHRFQNMVNLFALCFDWRIYFSYPFVEWLDVKPIEYSSCGWPVRSGIVNDVEFLYYDKHVEEYSVVVSIQHKGLKIEIDISYFLESSKCENLRNYMLVNKQFYKASLSYVNKYNDVEFLPGIFDYWNKVRPIKAQCGLLQKFDSFVADRLVHMDDSCRMCLKNSLLNELGVFGSKDSKLIQHRYALKIPVIVDDELIRSISESVCYMMKEELFSIKKIIPSLETGLFAYCADNIMSLGFGRATDSYIAQKEYYDGSFPYHIIKLFVSGSFGIGRRLAMS